MEPEMNTYLSFAENDYLFFKDAYDHGLKGTAMASIGQNICERYLKHLVSEYAQPETEQETVKKENVLRTHSLRRLVRYLEQDMGIEVPDDAELAMDRIDGFYFTTRYPGDESFIATERDVDRAHTAVEKTRDFVYQVVMSFEED